MLPLPFENAGNQENGIGIVGRQIFRHPGIGERVDVGILAAKGACDGVEDLGQPVLGARDQIEGHGLAVLQRRPQRQDRGIAGRPEALVDQRDSLGIAFELAQDFGMGHDAPPRRPQWPAIVAGEDRVRALEIADRGKRQRLVVEAEGFQPAHLRDGIEGAGRLGHLALAQKRPGAVEAIDKLSGRAALVERGDDRGVVFLLRKLGQDQEIGDLALAAGLVEFCGDGQRLVDRAAGDLGDRGMLHQHRVLRIGRERPGVIFRRDDVVGFRPGQPRGEIGARLAIGGHRRRRAPESQPGGKDEGDMSQFQHVAHLLQNGAGNPSPPPRARQCDARPPGPRERDSAENVTCSDSSARRRPVASSS